MEKSNHLIDSTSPYLLQHAHNPVDWHPWGDEAIHLARRGQKPIFLSIGYSACHWCHVMEREVFENPEIAAIMNQHFVNIKVDREERPDLDELYMLATQIMSGSGGWPMSVWLTPDLEPFYAGTYFPPVDGHGRPGFPKLELAIADAWQNKRADLVAQSKKVVEAIRMHADETAGGDAAHSAPVDLQSWLREAFEQTADRFDAAHGGLGGAPKFPPHQALHLWLAMLQNPAAADLPPAKLELLRRMTTQTLDAMMRGGIYDHVGGGFARYSTDERWLIPHFEKMLYDNAQLAPAYALASVLFQRPDYARVARQTLDFWLREMTAQGGHSGAAGDAGGGFFSTLDADSEGAEGKFYVWTLADIHTALPAPDDAALIIKHFDLTAPGNWHESPVEGGNVLAIAWSVSELAEQRGTSPEALQKRIDALLADMRAFRAQRIPPHLDDKILTSWNGLMISALAIAGRVLHEPRYLEAAHHAMNFLLAAHMENGRKLLRVSRRIGAGGHAHIPGFLEDHAFLLNGLMDLADATLPTSLPGVMAREQALELANTLLHEFGDLKHGGFFFTASSHDPLFARMKNAADNAAPSANGMAIRGLLRIARALGKVQYREAATNAVHAFAANIERRPDFFPTILQSLLEDAASPAHFPAGVLPSPALADHPATTAAAPVLHLIPMAVKQISRFAFEIRFQLAIAENYHIQLHEPGDKQVIATLARLRSDAPFIAENWRYPPNTPGVAGYSGTIELICECALREDQPAGQTVVRATVLAQPCTASACLAPEKATAEFQLLIEPA